MAGASRIIGVDLNLNRYEEGAQEALITCISIFSYFPEL